MLAEAGILPGDVPVRHPAELFSFVVLKDNQEGIQGDFLFLFPQPGLKLFRKERRYYFEFTVTGAKLEIEA